MTGTKQKMKQRIKTYKFWVSFSAALIIFLKALGKVFQFDIDDQVVDGVVMGFCGLLVVLGIVTKDEEKPDEQNQNEQSENDEKNDNKNNKK